MSNLKYQALFCNEFRVEALKLKLWNGVAESNELASIKLVSENIVIYSILKPS